LSLGLEFSGTVQATGQRVFGVAKNALASHCTPLYSFATPTELSDEEAASIPVVYLTAYYALVHKAQCREGQSVLIHAGSGGVGMAAIRVAQKRGLKVFTTCSSSKRQFLKENFCLEDHQIGDSRCEAFLETVLSGTNQRGVHIVLNSLAGSLQKASLRCLAPGGHFCEIGKFDVMENSEIALGLLAANISFHVIDLLPLLSDSSHKPLWDSMLRNGFEAKEIVPLPVTTFKSQEIVEAFRSMSQGKHVGKIVVTNLGKSEADALLPLQSMLFQETHLVTGGLGGVGLALASRLAENGCRHIILVGRRGVTTEFQRNQITNIEARGCRVDIFQTDLLALSQSSCNPQIIWHVATVYRDAIFSEMTSESWDQVMQTKVDGM
jgi:fatty acid synthase